MESDLPHIEVIIDAHEPIELADFVSAFTSVASQYRRYLAKAHPDLKDDAQILVREVRQGSIVADLLPVMASLSGLMDQLMIVDQFVRTYGVRLAKYFKEGGELEDASKSELNDFMGQISAIARSKNGKGSISSVVYEDGKRQVRAAVTFNTKDAVTATRQIERHQKKLEKITSAERERVLMVFKRSDVGDAGVGVRSGERVIIEEISDKDMALIYASPLAEQRIKDQMRNADENIFHKGFVVDVNIRMSAGRTVAYAVTHVHQVIDLPT
jgi:hypothetical protein